MQTFLDECETVPVMIDWLPVDVKCKIERFEEDYMETGGSFEIEIKNVTFWFYDPIATHCYVKLNARNIVSKQN